VSVIMKYVNAMIMLGELSVNFCVQESKLLIFLQMLKFQFAMEMVYAVLVLLGLEIVLVIFTGEVKIVHLNALEFYQMELNAVDMELVIQMEIVFVQEQEEVIPVIFVLLAGLDYNVQFLVEEELIIFAAIMVLAMMEKEEMEDVIARKDGKELIVRLLYKIIQA